MSKCRVCIDGKALKEGLDFYGMSAILTYEIGVCSYCMGTGFCTGD
jgi:hypothetical protein